MVAGLQPRRGVQTEANRTHTHTCKALLPCASTRAGRLGQVSSSSHMSTDPAAAASTSAWLRPASARAAPSRSSSSRRTSSSRLQCGKGAQQAQRRNAAFACCARLPARRTASCRFLRDQRGAHWAPHPHCLLVKKDRRAEARGPARPVRVVPCCLPSAERARRAGAGACARARRTRTTRRRAAPARPWRPRALGAPPASARPLHSAASAGGSVPPAPRGHKARHARGARVICTCRTCLHWIHGCSTRPVARREGVCAGGRAGAHAPGPAAGGPRPRGHTPPRRAAPTSRPRPPARRATAAAAPAAPQPHEARQQQHQERSGAPGRPPALCKGERARSVRRPAPGRPPERRRGDRRLRRPPQRVPKGRGGGGAGRPAKHPICSPEVTVHNAELNDCSIAQAAQRTMGSAPARAASLSSWPFAALGSAGWVGCSSSRRARGTLLSRTMRSASESSSSARAPCASSSLACGWVWNRQQQRQGVWISGSGPRRQMTESRASSRLDCSWCGRAGAAASRRPVSQNSGGGGSVVCAAVSAAGAAGHGTDSSSGRAFGSAAAGGG